MLSKVLSWTIKRLLALRYDIEIRDLDKCTTDRLNRKGGILFLSNHPAHIDPLVILAWLWPQFRMRPLVVEYVARMSFLKPLHRLVKSISIPNFETVVNEIKVKKGEESLREISKGLKQGDNFLIYPAGRLKDTGKELLGGASGVHSLLEECEDVNIVLIRTTGLWGSSFSRAITGRSPDIGENLWHGLKVLFKNAIFFTPRRKIIVEMESNPSDFPQKGVGRLDLNRYLENWYNRYPGDEGQIQDSEPLKFVSYSRWKEEFLEIKKQPKTEKQSSNVHVSEETKNSVYQAIKQILDRQDLEIKDEMNLASDLGMDSLNLAEFGAYITKNFHVGELYPEDLQTVSSVLTLIESGGIKRVKQRPSVTFTWPNELNRPIPMTLVGRTIPEAFLYSCQRMGCFAACGDDVMGVLTYKKLKRAVLVLAQHFRLCKEEKIAVLLPATQVAYITILAIQFAGKIPVMLNWTLGSRYLEEMMKISGAKQIVTSWRFIERLANVQFGSTVHQIVYLEDIRKKLSLAMKLKGIFLTHAPQKFVIRSMKLDRIDENLPCVILFTSGTEAVPKGVPLSHKNIIANQRSSMQCIDLRSTDVMYGVLPPFHSFGFSVTGLFSILGGIRIAFYPDPTDSFALAEGVERWKITLFCSAPSFLKGLFLSAKKKQLLSVRYFVSGAEKAPQELFDRVTQLDTEARIVEGYGITECSPVLSMTRPNEPAKGVGRILPDVELITIHPETLQMLPPHTEGELCVRGPNVFNGYLGDLRSPFIEIDGRKWYRTGDIGHLEPDGNLILTGRLKRFVKIGGEMISLGAIEEVIVRNLLRSGQISADVPSLAVCEIEREGKPQLILFSIIDIDHLQINQILQQEGFSNLIKISAVKKIKEIPLMGSGKTNYRKLKDETI